MSVLARDPQILITAVIPTYRRPRLLRRAITSVLTQEGAPLQVCVYDNASGGETASVVAELAACDSRLRYHCHATNLGSAANFDYGLRHVETPFFSILSDDDYLLPGFYQHALAGLAAHPEAMFWAGLVLNVDMDGLIWDARVDRWRREGFFAPPEGFMQMLHGMAPAWTGIVFRREVLELEGFPDSEVGGPSDLEFCLRLAARFPYVVEKHPAAVFTLNNESFSATQPLAAFWPGWRRMMDKFGSDDALDGDFKKTALAALRLDARRMLFRRSANALAAARMDFVREAATALDLDCKSPGRACLLRTIAHACVRSSLAQRAYATAYWAVESRIVRSRSALQAEYGSLLQLA